MQSKSNIEKCLDEHLGCTVDQLIDAFIGHSKPDAQLTADTVLSDERTILKKIAECNRLLAREAITPRIMDISMIEHQDRAFTADLIYALLCHEGDDLSISETQPNPLVTESIAFFGMLSDFLINGDASVGLSKKAI